MLIAVVIMLTTSGFNVFYHYCTTSQASEYSFIIAGFNCAHSQKASATINAPECCSSSDEKNDSCHHDDCCITETFLVKLEINLDQQNSGDFSFKIISLQKEDPFTKAARSSGSHGQEFHYADLPPPLSGKALRIFLGQLNISSAIV